MKPFHRRATIPTSVASRSSSSINNDGVRDILRGGSTEIQLPEHDDDADGEEEYEYIEDGEGEDEYYYEEEVDENHIEDADCEEEYED